jgi:hypothetical protein
VKIHKKPPPDLLQVGDVEFISGFASAAAWAVSVYPAYQRTWKPFNPILGETYEMVNHNGVTFLAEQVSCRMRQLLSIVLGLLITTKSL